MHFKGQKACFSIHKHLGRIFCFIYSIYLIKDGKLKLSKWREINSIVLYIGFRMLLCARLLKSKTLMTLLNLTYYSAFNQSKFLSTAKLSIYMTGINQNQYMTADFLSSILPYFQKGTFIGCKRQLNFINFERCLNIFNKTKLPTVCELTKKL